MGRWYFPVIDAQIEPYQLAAKISANRRVSVAEVACDSCGARYRCRMSRRLISRIIVPTLAAIGALSIVVVLAVVARGVAQNGFGTYACVWHLISETTCYPDSGPTIYDEIASEIAAKDQLEKDLAPILAEQERLKSKQSEWDKNARAIDLDVQRAFIVGCEQDKLTMMRNGKNTSSIDCRKGSALR